MVQFDRELRTSDPVQSMDASGQQKSKGMCHWHYSVVLDGRDPATATLERRVTAKSRYVSPSKIAIGPMNRFAARYLAEETKICHRCQRRKSVDSFYNVNTTGRNGRKRKGRESLCKSCQNESKAVQQGRIETYVPRRAPSKLSIEVILSLKVKPIVHADKELLKELAEIRNEVASLLRKVNRLYACRECGHIFLRKRDTNHYCSKNCSWRALRRKRRALKRSAFVESVDLIEVAERDGWRCQLCGKKVKRKPKEYKRQAVLDHIVPLSKGGLHCYSNVQLAHFDCNDKKSNRLDGQQLRML